MIQRGALRFSDIVLTNFDPSIGHEFQGKRPAVVIETDAQLSQSTLATIMPITSNMGGGVGADDDIPLFPDAQNNLFSDSVIKVQYITSVDYDRFCKKIGRVDANTLAQIKLYLKKHFDI